MSEEAKSGEPQTKFTDLLKLLALATGVAGALLGLKVMADSSFENVIGWLYIVGGLSSAALWWSLAIIVAAARRYLEKNRE